MTEAVTELDPEKLKRYSRQIAGTVQAGFNCAISALGHQLGIYQAMHEFGPATPSELAEHMQLHPRWMREWLEHQACNGQIEYESDGARFYLSPEAVAVLVDESQPSYFGGGFGGVVSTIPSLGALHDSFRTGLGLNYDAHGQGCACSIEMLSQHMHRFELVPKILPLLSDMMPRLEAGAKVADVGCGAALSTIAMAQAFPASEFVAYDISEHALQRARDNLATAGLNNISVRNALEEPLPDSAYFDLITTFDVIHDTPYPDRLIAQIRAAMKDDGMWLCEDIRSFPDFEQNLQQNPIAGLLYGFSVMVCMSSGMSTPDGAGLGTLGFNEKVAQEMSAEAGFSRFRKLPYDNPMNNFYEIRA